MASDKNTLHIVMQRAICFYLNNFVYSVYKIIYILILYTRSFIF